jgi:hypothetical protein
MILMKKFLLVFASALLFLSASAASAQETLSVRVRVSSITENFASVFVDGWPAAQGGESYTLIRRTPGGGTTNINVGTGASWRDQNVPTGNSYTYEIQRKQGGALTGAGTSRTPLNLNIREGSIVRGVGWGAMAGKGIGWISVNNASQEQGRGNHSSVPYGVYADTDGLMHGVMWAAHESGTGYGWLSFNDEDLEGCPNGECAARIGADGKLYGWARFINGEAPGSWGGWVSLRGVAGGNNFGLCFGDSTGGTVTIGKSPVSLGESCAGNGGANHKVLTGLAWAGDTIGGWLVFASSSLNIITPTSTGPYGIEPPGPHKIAIRDTRDFSANLATAWFIAGALGGNDTYGRMNPSLSGPSQFTRYTAPDRIPQPANTTLRASSTEETENGIVTDSITIVRPYDLVCLPEGQTSMRLIITKNYTSTNYPAHRVTVRGAKATPPQTVIASSNGPLASFAHTDLDEKTTYYYELETVFTNDGYSVRTPIVSCRTGESPAPIGTVTGMNAYANSSRSIIVNWKDTSRATTPYEFELQRMKVTPSRNYTLRFEATGSKKVQVSWENPTVWVPYTQELWRSEDGGANYALVRGQVLGWTAEEPPASPQQYVFEDGDVGNGRQYQYKVKVCAALSLRDVYSTAMKGSTGKPDIVCVESDPFPYTHGWSGGEEENLNAGRSLTTLTASFLGAVQELFERSFDAAASLGGHIADFTRTGIAFVSRQFGVEFPATAAGPDYSAYFRTAVITKNPAFKDEELDSDSVYLYRVSILSEDPTWSNLRAAKTLKDDAGGTIENRPVCMRNSFCDSSIPGLQSGDFSESSEQQCVQNRDCVNVGRSDQGFQER